MTNNIKQERRYRRTEALILNGLTTLLQQKSIKEITVRELADLVDINRSTFYLHYTDIYDLLEKTEQRLLQQLMDPGQGSPDPALVCAEGTPGTGSPVRHFLCPCRVRGAGGTLAEKRMSGNTHPYGGTDPGNAS